MSDLVITMEDSTPTPPAGTVSIYPKTDGKYYTKNAAGVEYPLKGDPGIQGDPGQGLAAGGTTGQVLKKLSGTDYATGWDGLTATEIANSPSGNLAAPNVQAALNELQGDVDTRATSTALTTHTGNTSNPHSVTKTQVGLANVQNLDQTNPANITQDATHRFATDTEKTLWNAQDALKIKGVVINDAAKADKKILQYNLATDRVIYADAAGGGGGGSLQWVETSSAPISEIENDMRVFKFQLGIFQQLFTIIRVPSSYLAGKQIKLHVPWYSPDGSGNARLEAYGSLFKPGLTSMSGNPGNVDVSVTATLAAGTVDKLQVTTLALTDASGQCAGIAVAPGDLIKLYISRGADTATSDMRVLAYAAEVTFQ